MNPGVALSTAFASTKSPHESRPSPAPDPGLLGPGALDPESYVKLDLDLYPAIVCQVTGNFNRLGLGREDPPQRGLLLERCRVATIAFGDTPNAGPDGLPWGQKLIANEFKLGLRGSPADGSQVHAQTRAPSTAR